MTWQEQAEAAGWTCELVATFHTGHKYRDGTEAWSLTRGRQELAIMFEPDRPPAHVEWSGSDWPNTVFFAAAVAVFLGIMYFVGVLQ